MSSTWNRIARKTGLRFLSKADLRLLDTLRSELIPPGFREEDGLAPRYRSGDEGLLLDAEKMAAFLGPLGDDDCRRLFARLRGDPGINPGFRGVDYAARGLIHNGFYPTPDAELYAAMIRWFRPTAVTEVGSGYSTAVARAAVDHLGLPSKIRVIDPAPRRAVENLAHAVEYRRVEDSSLLADLPGPGTLLFIDSSHVCRRGGDLPFLYCRVLPSLPPGVLVHVHDVFIPFDYPDVYVRMFYTEQYLLHAFLAGNPRCEVVFATHFMSRTRAAAMQAVFGEAVGREPIFNGASFWFQTR
ncbi:MAG: class I SAM-dependent methyltransferase [Acidobacteria bacterium]|nr:class I SAM-dependent methyltransferase [Acidobacteriota bacterium]